MMLSYIIKHNKKITDDYNSRISYDKITLAIGMIRSFHWNQAVLG